MLGRTCNLRHRAQGMLCFLRTLRFKPSPCLSVRGLPQKRCQSEAFFYKDAAVVSDHRDGVSVSGVARTEMVSSMKM